jgi:pectin methylesterase-like acyl-CoA thioesterase
MNTKFLAFVLLMQFSVVLVFSQPVQYIVAADGSATYTTVQAAIDACPNGERSVIFVKNGTYYGQTYLGSKTVASTKLISLIGESRDGVILTYDKALPMVTKFEDATTFQIYAKDFYAENITFANTAGVSAGQALALYTAGDRATFKNCYLRGFQDTYRSKKGTRAYLKECKIEGTVDFIYAGGTVFFDDCEIYCLQGGGYIVAPEDAYQTIPKTSTVCDKFLRLGFIFRNCNITAQTGVADNSYYLGRPWNVTSGAYYLNCTLGKHINPKGWKEWNGSETTASFAEFKSQNPDGTLTDVSGRVSWSFQLPEADVNNLFTTAGIYSRISSELYQPEPICVSPLAPNILTSAPEIKWNKVNGAMAYIISKNNRYLAITTDTVYVDLTLDAGILSVKTMGSLGQLSKQSTFSTALKTTVNEKIKIKFENGTLISSQPLRITVFFSDGKLAHKSTSYSTQLPIKLKVGTYIIKAADIDGVIYTKKLIYTPF